jgi:hypothetical protein
MPEYPKLLYPFRYRCERTGKWVHARYQAELHVIRERYAEWEITEEPMVITGDGGGTFNPFREPSDPR